MILLSTFPDATYSQTGVDYNSREKVGGKHYVDDLDSSGLKENYMLIVREKVGPRTGTERAQHVMYLRKTGGRWKMHQYISIWLVASSLGQRARRPVPVLPIQRC